MIQYVQGDATNPQGDGDKLIVHVCNDVGAWGAGFVLAISERWKRPELAYLKAFAASQNGKMALGSTQLIQVESHIWVVNMIAQRGLRPSKSGPPIRYDALTTCLSRVAEEAKRMNASVHMPRIGCGLAGGKWEKIEPIITKTLIEASVPVTVYDLEVESKPTLR